jgi:malate dehydrogenase (oxaloacetate-decarboxylating)(NADP+)
MNQNSKRRGTIISREANPGKIQVVPTKKYATQRFVFSLYTSVEPCLEIAKDVNNVYKYTAKVI